MTPVELRTKGYQLLVSNLGQADAIRFLQQMGGGQGNYTQERSEVLDSVTQEEFWQDLENMRRRSG
ncbi:hypothetical protein [Roseofilum casamattae]|uniref:Uncharacterized protein n=1 Tax=Roseofilum casamattae BLCC-M143 TaxID=3022442 RepID=A0ABT7BVL4_9CYAN|nr:hypothetical protein [Roseofilum casamattae]MDJ1183213.1 hypothetical protein [Roseofilum casamattae BLCC-M143]